MARGVPQTSNMHEIRICWLPEIEHALAPGRSCGPWMPWSLENIDVLMEIQQAGVATYGPASHWVEEREAAAPGQITELPRAV